MKGRWKVVLAALGSLAFVAGAQPPRAQDESTTPKQTTLWVDEKTGHFPQDHRFDHRRRREQAGLLTAPANNAVVSETISLSCTVPSNVEWINLDVDNSFYASGSAYATSYTTTWNSTSVADGSHSIACAGYGSNGALLVNSVANITVSNSIATRPHTPVGCTTIPGTNTPVGTACFPQSSYPTLNNPQNPVNYGADNTGVADSTTAITNALGAGDAYFSTPGTYLVSLSTGHGIVPPAGRTIECVPGVTLIERIENSATDSGILSLENGGNTVVGCDFQGGNFGSGAAPLGSTQGQFLIMIDGNNDTVEGNTFENAWGNSAVQTNSDYTGIAPANFMIQYNTFSHNPIYGPGVTDASSGIVQNNYVQDSSAGVENDSCTNSGQHITKNVSIRNNEMTVSVGNCSVANPSCGSGWPVYITGGDWPLGCDYSTVAVENNYCQGKSGTQAAQIRNDGPASYSNDTLGADCPCYTGSSSC